MGAKLEYDDSGATFYYFVVSFYGIILLPVTYFLFPRFTKGGEEPGLVCQCEQCRIKKTKLQVQQPKQRVKHYASYVLLLVLWGLLAFMVYKVLTVEADYTEYDPFAILQLDPGASTSAIRKQYRQLSKIYHPDKEGGNQDMFMKIAKAYEALTDEVSRANWEKYGNPDGPRAASFGIALPAWIVEKQNSIIVLGLYMSVFIIGLPLIVGWWWYKSVKYGHTNVLIQTDKLFFYFLSRSKAITIKRIMMILTAAFEFNPSHGKAIGLRATDDLYLSEVIRSKALPHIDIKTKEQPFASPYAAKTRILIHAHLERLPLQQPSLLADQQATLRLCPQLLQEMMTVLQQLWVHGRNPQYRRENMQSPFLDTFENVMMVSQMLVQAMWPKVGSPLLQLPHLQPEHLKHFRTRRRNIATIEQFAAIPGRERRQLVRMLSEEEYLDVMAVCSNFPHISIKAETQVVDDDDHRRITAGSLVTVSVTLTRSSLADWCHINLEALLSGGGDAELSDPPAASHDTNDVTSSKDSLEVETVGAAGSSNELRLRKPVVSNSQTRRGKKAGSAGKMATKSKKKQKGGKKKTVEEEAAPGPERSNEEQSEDESPGEEGSDGGEGGEGGEDEEWNQLQRSMQKHTKKTFEQSGTKSHPVHAAYFPEEKQECWWLYIANRRRRELISLPQRIVGLETEHSVDLHFAAPPTTGVVRYTVSLTSDSYIDLNFHKELKLEVHEHQEVTGQSQWKELEEEEEAEELMEESDSGEEDEEGGSESWESDG